MGKVQAIIPAAGSGERLKSALPKSFVEIRGKPLCVHALEAFERSRTVDSVILVGARQHLKEFGRLVERFSLRKVVKIVAGGETRCVSVAKGLAVLDRDTDIVVVHDAARPLIDPAVIDQAVEQLNECQALVVAVPVSSTLKAASQEGKWIERTIDRKNLWEIQTPQVFQKDILAKANAQNKDIHATDDAMLVEHLGIRVKVFPGDRRNIKVTTPEDIALAEALCRTGKELS